MMAYEFKTVPTETLEKGTDGFDDFIETLAQKFSEKFPEATWVPETSSIILENIEPAERGNIDMTVYDEALVSLSQDLYASYAASLYNHMEKRNWVVYSQKENGDGEVESYINREEAIMEAESEWSHLTDKEKKNITIDVFQTDTFNEEGQGLIPEDGYYPVWENGDMTVYDEALVSLSQGLYASYAASPKVVELYSNDRDAIVEDIVEDIISYPYDHFESIDEYHATEILSQVYQSLGKDIPAAFEADPDAFLNNLDLKSPVVQEAMKEALRQDLQNDDLAIENNLEFCMEKFSVSLQENLGLLHEPEKYLIMGKDIGYRNASSYKVIDVSESDDILQALRGDYDYTAKITKQENKDYLEAMIYTHDSPDGESYTIIPASYLSKALTDPKINEKVYGLAKEDVDVDIFVKTGVKDDAKDMLQQGVLDLVEAVREKEAPYLPLYQQNYFKESLAYNLVKQPYEEFHKNVMQHIGDSVVGNSLEPEAVVLAIQNGPCGSCPSKFDKICKETPAILALKHMIEKSSLEKIKQTLNNLWGEKREKECKHLKNEGKALSGR